MRIEAVEDDFASRVFGVNDGQLYKPGRMDNGGGGMPQGMNGEGFNQEMPLPDRQQNVSFEQPGTFSRFAEDGRGFGQSGGGADLIYTDDRIGSYAQIFNNTVLSKTKKSDQQRVVTALKHLNEGTDPETYVDGDSVLRFSIG